MKNIRGEGNYEIVIYDESDNRIGEYVCEHGYTMALAQAEKLAEKGQSYTIAKIVKNSKYNKWGVNR